MNLYHCTACGPFGMFGDYVWARTKTEAEIAFQNTHHVWPLSTVIERKSK